MGRSGGPGATPWGAYGGGTVTFGSPSSLDDGGRARQESPTTAAAVTILGGFFVLVGGISELIPSSGSPDIVFGSDGEVARVLGYWGVAAGLLLVVLGVISILAPSYHLVFGLSIICVALGSVVSNGGGFFIGLALGLIGGVVVARWSSSPVSPPAPGGPAGEKQFPGTPGPNSPEASALHYRG